MLLLVGAWSSRQFDGVLLLVGAWSSLQFDGVLLLVGAWSSRREMQQHAHLELRVLLFMDPRCLRQDEEGGWARDIDVGDKENKEEMGARFLWHGVT